MNHMDSSESMPVRESETGDNSGRVETSSESSQQKSQNKLKQRRQEEQTRKDRVEKNRSETDVPESIAHKEIVNPRQFLDTLQGGKPTPITANEFENYSGIVKRHGGFSEDEVSEMSKEEMVSNLQEVLRQVKIEDPTNDDYQYRADTVLRIAEESTERVITDKLQSRDEVTLTVDILQGKIDETGLGGRAEADVEELLGSLSKGTWFEQLPEPEEFGGKFGEIITEARNIGNAGYKEEEELKQLSKFYLETFSKAKAEINTDQTFEEVAEMDRILNLRRQFLNEELNIDAEIDREIAENQAISYGSNSLTKIRNIGKVGGLKKDLSQADKEIKSILEPEQMAGLRKLAISDFEHFKEGVEGFELGGIKIEVEVQRTVYAILAAEQKNWVHEKLEKLPLDDLDISQVGTDPNFREFNSGQVDMLPEVAEYARSLEFMYQAKYIFEVDGMDGLAKRASLMKTAEEVLTRQVDGWDEVVSEIEGLNIRDYDEELDGTGSQLPDLQARFLRFLDIPDPSDPESLERFKKRVKKEYGELSDSQKELVVRAAKGRYIVTWNQEDGSVKDMTPKTGDQISIDKLILGINNESYLVGGFVGYINQEEVDATRKYLIDRATKAIIAEDKLAMSNPENETKYTRVMSSQERIKDANTRARIASFAGEWMFWRMKGRSAYWGQQGGVKGQGGGRGEFDMFAIQGFQHYATQESKGLGETGREMRILLFGADGRATLNDEFVPGMVGGMNFNLGLLDFYSTYTVVFPGERSNKPLQNAGFIRGYDEFDQTKSNESNSKRIHRIMTEAKVIRDETRKKKMSVDEIEGMIRERMPDSDKDFLAQYNNLPIVTLAGKSARLALQRMKEGTVGGNQYEDTPDFLLGDLEGAKKAKDIMTDPTEGFMTDPNVGQIASMALQHEGRKRVWQKAKLMHDMTVSMIEFRNKFNEKLKNGAKWNSDQVDSILTDIRNSEHITERTKKTIEREVYDVITPEWERPLAFMRIPIVHKLVWVYSKKPINAIVIGVATTLWEGFLGFIKGFQSILPRQ